MGLFENLWISENGLWSAIQNSQIVFNSKFGRCFDSSLRTVAWNWISNRAIIPHEICGWKKLSNEMDKPGLSNRIGNMYLQVTKLDSPPRRRSRPVPTVCFFYFATPMGVLFYCVIRDKLPKAPEKLLPAK